MFHQFNGMSGDEKKGKKRCNERPEHLYMGDVKYEQGKKLHWSWGAFGKWVVYSLFFPFLGWWLYSICISILVHAIFGWNYLFFYWSMGIVGIVAVGLAIGDYLYKAEIISLKILP